MLSSRIVNSTISERCGRMHVVHCQLPPHKSCIRENRCTYVCMYVCVMWRYIVHVVITHARAQIDTVKIVSVDRVLTLNLAHQKNVAIVDWTGMGLNLTIRS